MRNISSFAENNYDYMDIFAQKRTVCWPLDV